MLLTSTNTISGKRIEQHKGLVHADVIYGANVFRDFFASVRDVIGGRTRSYEKVLTDAKNQAISELVQKAESMGANAVIGIDFDFEAIGGTGSALLVSVTGTAVVIEEE